MSRKAIAVLLLVLIMVLVIAAPAGASTSALARVTMRDFRFMPKNITVHVGDTVRWTNRGPSMHTTTSNTGVWDSGVLTMGQVFNFRFTTAGVYAYHCNIHLSMTGVITVTQ